MRCQVFAAVLTLLLSAVLTMQSFAAPTEPHLNFSRGGYWLTNPLPEDFTLIREEAALAKSSSDKVRLTLYKLSDRALLAQIITARAMRSLSEAELLRRVAETKPVWQGDLVLNNSDWTQIPLEAATGTLEFGVYILTAASGQSQLQTQAPRAAQWFAKTNLAIKAGFLNDRAFVTAIDSKSRAAYQTAQLQWCDSNGKVIDALATVPETGSVLLPIPANAAVLIAGSTDGRGDFDTVIVPASPQRQTVDGALIYPSAPVFQSGKPFSFLVAASGQAPTFTLNDETIDPRQLIPNLWQVDVPAQVKGSLTLRVSRNGTVLQSLSVPAVESQAYAVQWVAKPTAINSTMPATFSFRLRQNNKAAADVSGTLSLQTTTNKNDVPLTLPFTTNAAGIATVTLAAGTVKPEPLGYQLRLTIDGVPIASSKADLVEVYPADRWLSVVPQFSDSAVPENATAAFKVQVRQKSGAATLAPVTFVLARETYKFEWYQDTDGRWTYRTKTSLDTVQSGQAEPTGAGKDRSVTIAVPVDAGRYRLTVREANGSLESTQSFTAGWWLTQATPATPEKIELNAQVEGETLNEAKIAVFIDPPFAAHVWIAAVNIVSGVAPIMADVPDEGAFVYLPRSDLQPGQPLTLLAYGVSSDPSKSLVQAEGSTTIPLGKKLELAVNTNAVSKDVVTRTLTVTGLPVDQPLDKNIAQGFAAIYDDTTQTLLQMMPLAIDTNGAATIELPKLDNSQTRLRIRSFTTYVDRLDVNEQTVEIPMTDRTSKRIK